VDPGDPSLAMVHALYWLGANLAERRPVAFVVDDLQWADAASVRWLQYVQRRLEGLGLLIVVGARSGVGPDSDGAQMALAGAAGAVVLRPSELSERGSVR
jgi:hypothetical protein